MNSSFIISRPVHLLCAQWVYLGDTRPEFKMWGGTSKSLFVLVLKICQHQLMIARLSVVKITICILHCDKHFYKSTPESLINI